jgi:hypothetical protein
LGSGLRGQRREQDHPHHAHDSTEAHRFSLAGARKGSREAPPDGRWTYNG